MLTQTETTTWRQAVAGGRADVFYTLTNNYALRDWFCTEALLDERRGGRVYLGWNDGYYATGTFGEVVPDALLEFTWQGRGEPAAGQVRVALAEHDRGTLVTVAHTPPESASPGAVDEVARRWQDGLENLASAFETGVDLRLARRPMLGITGLQEINPERARQLGVPVDAGMRADGVLEGLGAARAGLQKDDVIVAIGGHEITTGSGIPAAVAGRKAGDTVEVVFYRGPQKMTRAMELSARPMPQYPATLDELVDRARQFYDTQNAELAAAFAGVSPREADYRPGPGEWNAREVVAHLVAVEHDSQTWIAMMSEGSDYSLPFRNNLYARISAIAAAYPTADEILEELRRVSLVSLGMLEQLPEHLVRRKYLFNQLAGWWTTGLDHTREHVGEIRGLLERARRADA